MPVRNPSDDEIVEALQKLISDQVEASTHVILVGDSERNYYIQFALQGDRLFCEAVSNLYLEPANELTDAQLRTLENLGWREPEHEGQNWFRTFRPASADDFGEIVSLVRSAFVEVYRLPSDAELLMTRSWDDQVLTPEMADATDRWSRWEQWVRRALGGSERQVAAATNAASGAIAAGGTQEQVVTAARAAWEREGASQGAALDTPAAEAQAASPAQAPASPSPRPRHESADPSATVGTVRNLSKGVGPYRGKPAALQIWTFRVETYDEQGNVGELMGVEMRGHEITGTLDNGDWVEIKERPKRGGGCRPKKVRNLTTNDLIEARYRWFMAQ
jgi:hypothetical protein